MEGVNLDKAVVVAEVYSKALRQDDNGLVACYFLAHDLDPADAEKAMNFFAGQPRLLVDVEQLVDDAQAEFPALVVIRYSDETRQFLATMHEFGILRELPNDDIVSRNGWDLFWMIEAMERGEEIPDAAPLPDYDYRSLRRKLLALRAMVEQDRDPWLVTEYRQLRDLTKGSPEGSENFVALADDMQAAIEGKVEIADAYSVVIPTRVERQREVGALIDWVPQTGREIVIAHGLDPLQAVRVLRLVRENKDAYVSGRMLASGTARETLGQPMIVPDVGLNWIPTDLTGRRNAAGYESLRSSINLHAGEAPVRGRDSSGR